MIPLAKELEVRRLLRETKLSRRSIAQHAGVSCGTVDRLALLDGPRPRPIQPLGKGFAPRSVPFYECRGCKKVVTWDPCVICAARAELAKKSP